MLEALIGKQPIKVESVVVPAQADVADVVEARQVEGEAAQHDEEVEVAPDVASILGQDHIANVVETILDAPMDADGMGGIGC